MRYHEFIMFNNFKNGAKKHNHFIDHLTELIAFLSGIALYPQVYKAFTTKQTGDLSFFTFSLLILTNSVWITYGFHRRSTPILISSGLNLIASLLLVGFIIVF